MDFFQWTTREGQTTRSSVSPTRDNPEFEEINELILLRPDKYFENELQRLKNIKGYVSQGEAACLKNLPIPCHNEFCQKGKLPPNLTIFRANNCNIWYWPKFPKGIVEIEMKNTRILTVPDLSQLEACTILILNDGIIDDVVGPLPPHLEVLGLASCAITKWTIGANIPDSLEHIFIDGNPSKTRSLIPSLILNRLNQEIINLQPQFPPRHINYNYTTNPQNVHESGFQESTQKNIAYLIKYKATRLRPMSKQTHDINNSFNIFSKSVWQRYIDLLNNVFKNKNSAESSIKYYLKNAISQEVFSFLEKSEVGKILINFMKTPYSMLGTTFIELTFHVLEKILDIDPNGPDREKRQELLRRLKEEVLDGEYKCTNGMVVRLTNVFVGFDENIEMMASTASILGARIPVLLEKTRKQMALEEGKETSDYWKKILEEIIKDMREMDLQKEKWNNWISDFIDSYKESLEKEGKILTNMDKHVKEQRFSELEIREPFLSDQIKLWIGLGDFE